MPTPNLSTFRRALQSEKLTTFTRYCCQLFVILFHINYYMAFFTKRYGLASMKISIYVMAAVSLTTSVVAAPMPSTPVKGRAPVGSFIWTWYGDDQEETQSSVGPTPEIMSMKRSTDLKVRCPSFGIEINRRHIRIDSQAYRLFHLDLVWG